MSGVTDHAFWPRREWWSLCEKCGLAEPAHEAKWEKHHSRQVLK